MQVQSSAQKWSGREKSAKMKNLRDRPLVDYRVLARSLLLLHAGKV